MSAVAARVYSVADDLADRKALATQLFNARLKAGLSRGDVARRLGLASPRSVMAHEHRTNWQVRTLQAWARAVGHRLHLDLDGLTVPDDGDPYAALYRLMTPTDPTAQDELAREVLVNNLRRIRVAVGYSCATFAPLLGIHATGVSLWDQCSPGMELNTPQRYARALGGRLVLRLEQVTG